ncbi:hypothetical protein DXN05_06500 [Deminuibacter soli]|uniref:Uncharacterized protein n=1 Tax=Deminuibacter soli TaxID=2291815 RepID=A0A3E1NKT4_9BACT|nr:hypothetical protein DXN05_06500 [Deminuibacter soli]
MGKLQLKSSKNNWDWLGEGMYALKFKMNRKGLIPFQRESPLRSLRFTENMERTGDLPKQKKAPCGA